jgi:hypothetical protein
MVLANTLVYYDATAVKSFIVQSTGAIFIPLYFPCKRVYSDRIFIPGRPLMLIYMFVSNAIVCPSEHLLFQVIHSRIPPWLYPHTID